ncbi:trafficking protein particle complex subunit 6b-like isoform X3 [Homarus americanus]|uniref:trafficking protein particle complex subunit 6b-like isoform X3 n=1 Tax=Homarus americanus TaxID=6706 RepID=UPI001C493BE7|nr:trafficking protein particle complex subunit 6b-like isoform X3 [Homarus americanus]
MSLTSEVLLWLYTAAPVMDEAISKLEHMGFATGYRLVERLTRESGRYKDELDIMKYICKDLWVTVYKKQIDNLRTNHQGVYVLHDNRFRFLSHMAAGKQYLQYAPRYLAFTCGLVRGCLANLGVTCVVTAEVTQLPACKFQIQVQRG